MDFSLERMMDNSHQTVSIFARRHTLSLMITIATLGLSACGGGGSSTSPKDTTPTQLVDQEPVETIVEAVVEPEDNTVVDPVIEEPIIEDPIVEETPEEPVIEEPEGEEPTFNGMTEDELRAIAPPALDTVPVPQFSDFGRYIENIRWAKMLGKALFWDQSSGSDGIIACASCHFKAGADNRSKNQLSPGLLDQTPGVNPTIFDVLESGNFGGPNYQLVLDDFPFPKEVNDVVSSQGVFKRLFNGVIPGEPVDDCTPDPDAIFHVGGINTRRVEPRNAPTTINAVFNHRNFWDGRANHIFNGFDARGARSNNQEGAGVWSWNGEAGSAPQKVTIEIENASLASQAVEPPLSTLESSCDSRSFQDIGRKLLPMRALSQQQVASNDSMYPPEFLDESGTGLTVTYAEMIRRAFKPEWWGAEDFTDEAGYSQMEANFSLFWGLAIQLYESTLVSDQTRYDAWANGESVLTEEELEGLAVFMDPEQGNCAECHGGAEFTVATVSERAGKNGEAVERMTMADGTVRLYDGGFYNIGVRQTLEDVANGGTSNGSPICFSRQLIQAADADDPSLIVDIHFNEAPFAQEGDPSVRVPVVAGERDACDGAFKSSTLRNIELTAPYFHNGGTATLEDVMRAYQAGFDGNNGFAEENIDDLHPAIPNIDIGGGDRDALVSFMLTLTDERVRYERAPFDHPSLCIPNGQVGDENSVEANPNSPLLAKDELTCLPAVGADGLETPQPNFLGLVEPVDDDDDDDGEEVDDDDDGEEVDDDEDETI